MRKNVIIITHTQEKHMERQQARDLPSSGALWVVQREAPRSLFGSLEGLELCAGLPATVCGWSARDSPSAVPCEGSTVGPIARPVHPVTDPRGVYCGQ